MEKELTLVQDREEVHSILLAPPNKATAAGNHGMSQLMYHAEWTIDKAENQDGTERIVDVTDFSHHGAIHSWRKRLVN